jgi:hypothetical protein
VKYIKPYPISEAFWNFKKKSKVDSVSPPVSPPVSPKVKNYTIDDLYIYSSGKTVDSENQLGKYYSKAVGNYVDKKYGMDISKVKDTKVKLDGYSTDFVDGYILDSDGYFSIMYSFSILGNYKLVSFDLEKKKLIDISRELGYSIGTKVNTINGQNNISSIGLVVFWWRYYSWESKKLNAICTPFYKCSDGELYQISQISKAEQDVKDDVENEIEDTMVHVQDIDCVEIDSSKGMQRVGKNSDIKMVYRIKISKEGGFSVDDMHEITSRIKEMKNRLGGQIKTVIGDLKHDSKSQYISIHIIKDIHEASKET